MSAASTDKTKVEICSLSTAAEFDTVILPVRVLMANTPP